MLRKQNSLIFNLFIYIPLALLVIAACYPLLYVLFASLSEPSRIVAHKGMLFHPLGLSFQSYLFVFKNQNVISGYLNTLFLVVMGLIVNLTMTILAAFVLSRKNVYWNKILMIFIVITMFFNGGLIPLYLVVKGIGLINSLWSVIIPFAINTFYMIIMRTAFQAIPESLEESAKIEGANHFTILMRIVLPLSLPVLAVMTLYYSVDRWNGWFYASIFLQDRNLFPLQLFLREILIGNSTDSMSSSSAGDGYQIGETIKYATIIVSTLPILVMFPFVQKYFVKGVMIGAVK
ncbi:ABC transporter permease subunit [Paenibacillus sp. LMG 31458]|uniref:ABC transporter permease subunit n=1 Tax=Paenibacillus phytorum TaxID=2654977 RepID=A0ABX1Y4R3_9BACL|nr:carbohydrate ABC transporter permease [Paenibacillus phytorum]NOU74990.1 ABC transporter permease subunit [Paenibacillus phytorum]